MSQLCWLRERSLWLHLRVRLSSNVELFRNVMQSSSNKAFCKFRSRCFCHQGRASVRKCYFLLFFPTFFYNFVGGVMRREQQNYDMEDWNNNQLQATNCSGFLKSCENHEDCCTGLVCSSTEHPGKKYVSGSCMHSLHNIARSNSSSAGLGSLVP